MALQSRLVAEGTFFFQDSYDLLTGAWIAKRGAIPPLSDTRPFFAKSVSIVHMIGLYSANISVFRCRISLHLRSLCCSPASPFLELSVGVDRLSER